VINVSRARYTVQSAAERAIHRVNAAADAAGGTTDASDGLLLVFIWIGIAFWALWVLGRHAVKSRRTALGRAPAWLRERLKLPRRLTPIGVPRQHARGGHNGA
jgi:hypothetical protein